MSPAVWFTRRGDRRVEQASLNGRPHFLVTDPRWVFQSPFTSGEVPIFVRQVDGAVVFAPVTVNGLRALGVELEDLDPEAPEVKPAPLRVLPLVRRRPGEPAGEANERRYQVFITALLADVAERREAS